MNLCPICKNKGKKVDTATVKALLAISLRHLSDVPYYFCATANCDVVYFSEDGKQTFGKEQVREPVYQKESVTDDLLICYCFQHHVHDVHANGASIAMDIREGIKQGQCACDWRNPQGDCCLGNVLQLMKRQD